MSLFEAVILAIVQGATEFLPVSSSGHLAFAGKLLGLPQTPLDYVVVVHFGTLIAVVAYYRHDLAAIARSFISRDNGPNDSNTDAAAHRRLLWLLLLGTIPAAIAGMLFEEQVDKAFGDIRLVGGALLFTAAVLAAVSRLRGRMAMEQTNWKHAIGVGMAQSFALIPGVSRSGCTIAAALACGLSRNWAPRFAFLLSIPIILGGTAHQVVSLINGVSNGSVSVVTYLVGGLTAALVGYLAIVLVIDSVRKGNLLYYSAYCIVVGLTAIAVGLAFSP